MKTISAAIFGLAALLLTSCAGLGAGGSGSPADRAAVERAVLDYVEALYEVKPELIERSVDPELTKYGYWREAEDDAYQGSAMEYQRLVDLAANWNADGSRAGETSPKEVVVLDVLDQTAAAKLTAEWGVDYMQLAKVDGRWMIRHVLWQTLDD